MFTVAEEVERVDDLDYLRKSGIQCVQGFATGSPDIAPVWHVNSESKTWLRLVSLAAKSGLRFNRAKQVEIGHDRSRYRFCQHAQPLGSS